MVNQGGIENIRSENIVKETLAGEAYVIQAGDTLERVAKKFKNKFSGLEVDDIVEKIKKYNGIKNENEIQAGLVLRLPFEGEGIVERSTAELEELKRILDGDTQIEIKEAIAGSIKKGKIDSHLNPQSITDMLNRLGVDSSLEKRKELYKDLYRREYENNDQYVGMNIALLEKIKELVSNAIAFSKISRLIELGLVKNDPSGDKLAVQGEDYRINFEDIKEIKILDSKGNPLKNTTSKDFQNAIATVRPGAELSIPYDDLDLEKYPNSKKGSGDFLDDIGNLIADLLEHNSKY